MGALVSALFRSSPCGSDAARALNCGWGKLRTGAWTGGAAGAWGLGEAGEHPLPSLGFLGLQTVTPVSASVSTARSLRFSSVAAAPVLSFLSR